MDDQGCHRVAVKTAMLENMAVEMAELRGDLIAFETDLRQSVLEQQPPRNGATSLPAALQTALQQMRGELVDGCLRLQKEHDHPPMVYPLHDHCLEIVERALNGRTSLREVQQFLATIEEVGAMRLRQGDHRNEVARERWAGVLRRLATTLAR